MKDNIYEAVSGESIHSASESAIDQAKYLQNPCTLIFNRVSVEVHPQSHAADIIEKYFLTNKINRLISGYED